MKRTIYLIVLLLLSAMSFAQENHFTVGTKWFKFYDILDYPKSTWPFDVMDVSFSRNISDNLNLKLTYSFTSAVYFNFYTRVTVESSILDPSALGKIHQRINYNFFDLVGVYNYRVLGSHKISFFMGPSVAYGTNEYLIKQDIWPIYPAHIVQTEFKEEKEGYFGGVSGISYSYHFKVFQQNFNAGADFLARKYKGNFPFSVHYGLHIGYSF